MEPRQSDIFQIGQLLNNTYRIEKILGRGGLSEVYLARSEVSGRVIAIKALRADFSRDESYRSLMTREENVREIQHAAVVRYFDTQRTQDGIVYLVMDFIEGRSLDDVLENGGMDASDLLVLGERVLSGLEAAHSKNIVHRDIAPDNIILRNGEPGEAVIIDFGIAKDTNPDAVTIVGNSFAGKLGYAAPEQFAGHTDARSDLYALGAALLSVFLGERPRLGAAPMEVMPRKMHPLDVTGVPEPLASLITKLTVPEANQRFQTANEARGAFERAMAGYPLDIVLNGMPASTLTPFPMDVPQRTITAVPPGPSVSVGPGGYAGTAPPGTMPGTYPGTAPPGTMPGTYPGTAPPGTLPGTLPGTPPGTYTGAAGATAYDDATVALTQPPQPPKKGKLGLLIGGLLAVAVAAGAGYWFFVHNADSGRFPVADPFTFTMAKAEDGSATASGFAPSSESMVALTRQLEALSADIELSLASGTLPDGWSQDVVALMNAASVLDSYDVDVSGGTARVTGLTNDRAVFDAATQALDSSFFPALDVTVALDLGPRLLDPASLSATLEAHGDCGALTVAPPPSGPVLQLNDTVRVTGQFADNAGVTRLRDALRAEVGNRPIDIVAEVLDPDHCRIDATLPPLPTGGFAVQLSEGTSGEVVTSGEFRVGQNPVIDVRLPDGVEEGFVWVLLQDVQGVIYNLLPSSARPDASLAALSAEATDGTVRAAFPVDIARSQGLLAILVDSRVVGLSRVHVIHSSTALFPQGRSTTERLDDFVAALEARVAADTGSLLAHASAPLLTLE